MPRLRLRQIALVAQDFPAAREELIREIGTYVTYVDESLDYFGLQNSLFPVGKDCFIEIVSPIKRDVTAQRYLDKYGDGGYMLLVQVSPLNDAKRVFSRIKEMNLKVIHAGSRANGEGAFESQPFDEEKGPGLAKPGIAGIHLHPKEVGCITEITSSLPENEWVWAADGWLKDPEEAKRMEGMDTVHGFAFASVACKDPEAVAQVWSRLLERPVEKVGETLRLSLQESGEPPTELRFCKIEAGQNEGVASIGVYSKGHTKQVKKVVGVEFSFVPLPTSSSKL